MPARAVILNSGNVLRSVNQTMRLHTHSALFLSLVLTATLLPAPGAAPLAARDEKNDPIDRILIVVNDDIITATEVDNRLGSVVRRLREQKINPPPEPVLRRQVMEHMVTERLQLQVARNLGLKVSDEQIERAIRTIAERRQTSVEALRKEVDKEAGGYTAFREELRAQLLAQQLVEREINNRIAVSEAEVEDYLAAQAARGATVEYNISHILITVPESAAPEKIAAARARAERVHDELIKGADFKQLAVAHSQGQNALEGGGLGWRSSGQLPELFVNALRELKPGEVSKVVRSPNGFHILRLNDRRGGDAAHNVTQTRARHILFRVNELTTPREAERRAAQLRERLMSGEDFAAAARARSDDIGSANNGGDLGWITPGQTVPEFERAMDTLKPGEISEPVKTPFGVHLIQVLERRERDLTREREQAQARSQILARKADERHELWLRQLRDEAFVEYRLDGEP